MSHQRTRQQWSRLLIGCRHKKKNKKRVSLLVFEQTDDCWWWECRTQSSHLVDTEWNTVFQPAQYNKLCSAAAHWHTHTNTHQTHVLITQVYSHVNYCQLCGYSIYCECVYSESLCVWMRVCNVWVSSEQSCVNPLRGQTAAARVGFLFTLKPGSVTSIWNTVANPGYSLGPTALHGCSIQPRTNCEWLILH